MKIRHAAFIAVIAFAMSLLVGCVSVSQGSTPPVPPFELEEVLALRLVR